MNYSFMSLNVIRNMASYENIWLFFNMILLVNFFKKNSYIQNREIMNSYFAMRESTPNIGKYRLDKK